MAVWHDELATLASITQVRPRNDAHLDGSVYTMHVKGGFYLDDFVAQGGVSNDAELIAFITGKITKGLLNMGISAPEIGCSSFTATTAEGDQLFAATMTSPRPIPAWCSPRRTKGGTPASPPPICNSWALTWIRI